MLHIRFLQHSDIPEIVTLFQETIHAINAQDYPKHILDLWAPKEVDYEQWHTKLSKNISYVAVLYDQIIGFADMTHDGLLDHLYVHKDFQSQGIASLLLEKLEEKARQLKLTEMSTESSITALPFFTKKGFSCIKQDKPYKDTFVSNHLCKKKLA